ncbi:hypothetical protein PT2222_420013 [Paraburkholderia tropica]
MSLHGLDIWIVRLALWLLIVEASRLAVLAQSPRPPVQKGLGSFGQSFAAAECPVLNPVL